MGRSDTGNLSKDSRVWKVGLADGDALSHSKGSLDRFPDLSGLVTGLTALPNLETWEP